MRGERELALAGVEQHQRGAHPGVQLLDQAHDGAERALERRIAGHELEHAALAESERVGAASCSDVDDACTNEPALR